MSILQVYVRYMSYPTLTHIVRHPGHNHPYDRISILYSSLYSSAGTGPHCSLAKYPFNPPPLSTDITIWHHQQPTILPHFPEQPQQPSHFTNAFSSVKPIIQRLYHCLPAYISFYPFLFIVFVFPSLHRATKRPLTSHCTKNCSQRISFCQSHRVLLTSSRAC